MTPIRRAHELDIGELVRVKRTGGHTDDGWEVMGLHDGRVHLTKIMAGTLYSKSPRYYTFDRWQEDLHFDVRQPLQKDDD